MFARKYQKRRTKNEKSNNAQRYVEKCISFSKKWIGDDKEEGIKKCKNLKNAITCTATCFSCIYRGFMVASQ